MIVTVYFKFFAFCFYFLKVGGLFQFEMRCQTKDLLDTSFDLQKVRAYWLCLHKEHKICSHLLFHNESAHLAQASEGSKEKGVDIASH